MNKYFVRHPNFEWFLRLFEKPIWVCYDDLGRDGHYEKHDWVRTTEEATSFESEKEARGHFTSPLCDLIVEPTLNPHS